MGIFSWLRRKPAKPKPKPKHSLIRYQYEDPKLEKVEQDAAADVAQVEQDARFFHRDDSWEG
jgi:hypothetical protein